MVQTESDTLRTMVYIEEEARRQVVEPSGLYVAAPFHKLKDGRNNPNDFIPTIEERRAEEKFSNEGYSTVIRQMVTAIILNGDPWVIFPYDLRESQVSLANSWTEKGINQEVQKLRLAIIRSDDYREQLSMFAELNLLTARFTNKPIAA